MLATFSTEMGGACRTPPSFLLRWLFFRIFSRGTLGYPIGPWAQIRWGTPPGLGCRTHLGSVFKGFVVHFVSFAALFLNFHLGAVYLLFVKNSLLAEGLVGLREAPTISMLLEIPRSPKLSFPKEFATCWTSMGLQNLPCPYRRVLTVRKFRLKP